MLSTKLTRKDYQTIANICADKAEVNEFLAVYFESPIGNKHLKDSIYSMKDCDRVIKVMVDDIWKARSV